MDKGEFLGGMVFGAIVASMFWGLAFAVKVGGLEGEAASRGYMVECVGKSGYYWECEE